MDIQGFKRLDDGHYKVTMYRYQSIIEVRNGKYLIDNQEIHTVATKVGYGERIWFICPSCGRNTKRLYKPYKTDPWECRVCHHLIYKTSRLSGNNLEYIDYQIEQLQSLFDMSRSYNYGGLPGTKHEQIPLFKPKYMRWEKFNKVKKELKILIKKRVNAWMKYL